MSEKGPETGRELFPVVETYFEELGGRFEVDRRRKGIFCQIAGTSVTLRLHVSVNEDERTLTVVTECPQDVPSVKRADVSELLARSNFNRQLGSLEMDWHHGGVRSRATVYMADLQPSKLMIRTLVGAVAGLMDSHYPALMAVLLDDATPEEALAAVSASGTTGSASATGVKTGGPIGSRAAPAPPSGSERTRGPGDVGRDDYIGAWSSRTESYGRLEGLTVHVPTDVAAIHRVSRPLTSTESESLARRIRRHKVIPFLDFFPARAGMPQTWWFAPFVVAQERIASWLAVDPNGAYMAIDGDDDSTPLCGFSDLVGVSWKGIEREMWRLDLRLDKGLLTFEEWTRSGSAGSYLQVLDAILDVYMPVVEASRSAPRWLFGAGGEGYAHFSSWEELLRDGGNWEKARRPKPA